jgi:hypothetical protein
LNGLLTRGAKDPEEKLEELRRNSLVELEKLWNATQKQQIPERDHPDSLAANYDGAAAAAGDEARNASLATQVAPEATQAPSEAMAARELESAVAVKGESGVGRSGG